MKNTLYIITGWMSLLTGLIGVLLPLLPTTPFLLLAAFCFSRGSTRLHHWLCSHPWFGPPIQEWQEHQTVSRSTKTKALFLILCSFTLTLVLAPLPLIGKASLLLLALVLMWFVVRLPESTQSDTTRSPTKEKS
ncbi:MAG: DUF454 family protein [Gammaproteobacteria bacterium]|nr:DUF454 family protein [Gammaproteobacteria bacterium]